MPPSVSGVQMRRRHVSCLPLSLSTRISAVKNHSNKEKQLAGYVCSSVWLGGPTDVKTTTWMYFCPWSCFCFFFFLGGWHVLPGGEVTTLWLKYVCQYMCVYVCVCICARQTVFSHAKGQDKDTKNRSNSKWQRGGRAKMEGLVIIKWRSVTHTHHPAEHHHLSKGLH